MLRQSRRGCLEPCGLTYCGAECCSREYDGEEFIRKDYTAVWSVANGAPLPAGELSPDSMEVEDGKYCNPWAYGVMLSHLKSEYTCRFYSDAVTHCKLIFL